MKRLSIHVTAEDHGIALLAFLKKQCPHLSSKALKRMIESKLCQINGRVEFFSSCRLMQGDEVSFFPPQSDQKCKSLDILVVFEDKDLLVINKPAGVVSEIDTLIKLLPYEGTLYLIHRLDKDTSGLLMLAKSKAVFDMMKDLFSHKNIQKYYLALVDNIPPAISGKIDTFLGKKCAFQGQTIYGSMHEGQRAITYWYLLNKGQKASLLLLEPKTGRTHQLRVHMKEMGCPILGDYQYTSAFVCKQHVQRHMLHAWGLYFIHPITKKEVLIQAPLSEDFCALANKIKVNLHAASDLAFLRSEVVKLQL